MSTSVIERQVEAFSDSVEDQPTGGDQSVTLEDAILVALNLGRMLEEAQTRKLDEGRESNSSTIDLFTRLARHMIKATSALNKAAQELQSSGHRVKGAAELANLLYKSREFLVRLQNSAQPQVKLPDYNDFSKAATVSPPPQSWFEEKIEKLG
jgi:hypothetical protein